MDFCKLCGNTYYIECDSRLFFNGITRTFSWDAMVCKYCIEKYVMDGTLVELTPQEQALALTDGFCYWVMKPICVVTRTFTEFDPSEK